VVVAKLVRREKQELPRRHGGYGEKLESKNQGVFMTIAAPKMKI
jgi:hypothetical protein